MAKGLKNIKIFSIFSFVIVIVLSCFLLSSCNKENINIKFYNIQTKDIENLKLEEYIEGVVAGEIDNNSPIEALKAQAVLARSFTMYFIKNNKSKYEGADISNDISEAQAYNKENINDKIKRAVKETMGIVLTYNDKYINTWFHSNSGGRTTTAKNGLNFLGEEPPYLKVIDTTENSTNTKNYTWSESFSKSEILSALRNMGLSISTLTTFEKGIVDESGRCLSFNVGGVTVNSNTFRLNIGSTKFKSTLINKITVNSDLVKFEGLGYGHGVGLSQEYAIILANQDKNYKDIIKTFYKDIKFKSINNCY